VLLNLRPNLLTKTLPSDAMGEATRKNRSKAAILTASPWCIYCGGIEQATTVDHMPPRMMFRGKLRPGQFEFPACERCNTGTKASDLVASFLGRIFPDAESVLDQEDMQKVLRGMANNMPNVLQEMHIGRAGQKFARKRVPISNSGGFLRFSGPLFHNTLTSLQPSSDLHCTLQLQNPLFHEREPSLFASTAMSKRWRANCPRNCSSYCRRRRHCAKALGMWQTNFNILHEVPMTNQWQCISHRFGIRLLSPFSPQ
jgi:hypothetical protein